MPTLIDKTVVASAYDTSGNGGRKLVRLDNGWLVAVTKTNDYFYFYVDKQDGSEFIPLCYKSGTSINNNDVTIVSNGNIVYAIYGNNTTNINSFFFNASTVSYGDLTGASAVDSNQTAIGNVSLAINEAKTRLYASWASKNATYPNSFNIRYAKGVIQADGSVVWGAVEQVTSANSAGQDFKNPSIIINNNHNPVIVYELNQGTTVNQIRSQYKDANNTWTFSAVFNLAGYAQSSPSAIFVPKSINGLANGRIWVAWHGWDSTDTNFYNVRLSYSDDGGVTWSAMQKLTTGNTKHGMVPTITANKKNEVFIVYRDGGIGITQMKWANNVWGSPVNKVANSGATNPSSLYSENFDFEEPLFVYQNTAKVGFYGSWTITDISVPPGDIGNKDNPVLLPYAITTDGAMSTITEKVNGVTVGTKTATSGQALAVSLTQAQWDAIRYGKYDIAVIQFNTSDWEQGIFSPIAIGSPPPKAVSTNRIRTKTSLPVFGGRSYKISIPTEYQILVVELDVNGNVVAIDNWRPNNYVRTMATNTVGVMFVLMKIDATDITTSILDTVNPYLVAYSSNTLTIEMGTNKWEYQFNKHLAPDIDLISIAKSVKDTNEVVIPSVKSDLIEAVMGKGGVVTGDKWEDVEKGIEGIDTGYKIVQMTQYVQGSYFATVDNLTFTPLIILARSSNLNNLYQFYLLDNTGKMTDVNSFLSTYVSATLAKLDRVSNGFTLTQNGFVFKNIGANDTFNFIIIGK